MFKKRQRLNLKQRQQFDKSIITPFFVIKYKQNNMSYNRYGFVIGKKIDARAVVRNKVRRKITAWMEKVNPDMKQGYEILFILKKNIFVSLEESYDSLIRVLKKEQLTI